MKNRIEFSVDGKKYYVIKPTQDHIAQAEFIYKTKYSEALRYGALTHHEAQRIIEERNLFTEEDSKKAAKLLLEVSDLGHKLEKEVSVSAGLDTIIQIDTKRREILHINRKRNAILDNTAEAYADEQRLHLYIVSCTYEENGERVFTSTENLISRSNDEVAVRATRYAIYMIANEGEDFRVDWPDYQWRVKHGLVDGEMNPVEEFPEDFKNQLEQEQRKLTELTTSVTGSGSPKISKKRKVAKKV